MIEASFAQMKGQLLPLIHATRYHSGSALPPLRIPFLPLLFAHVALPHNSNLELLVPEDAAEFGLSFSDLLAIATQNLALRECAFEAHPDAPGVFCLTDKEGLAAARLLLLPRLLQQVDIRGPVVAAIPSSATLLVAALEDAPAIERLLDLSETEWLGHVDAVSPVPYTLTDGAVRELTLASGHGLYDRVRRAHVAFLTRAYAEQRASLLRAASERGVEVAIAICGAIDHPETGPVTTTALAEGLMPITDFVFIVCDEKQAILVDYRDLGRLFPNRLVPAGDFEPPLLAVQSFPNDREIDALRAVAVWRTH